MTSRTSALPEGRRSHPPSLLTRVRAVLREEAPLPRGTIVLCACSGGPDSTALLHALARLREAFGIQVVAHGIDHGLRANAQAELELVAALAQSLDVPFGTTVVQLGRGGNLQARARAERYQALEAAAVLRKATVIAVGHTLDDRAETVLLRLLRGAGPRGLSVLPARAPSPLGAAGRDLLRPLIRARRVDVLAHLERHSLRYANDPSNLDPHFTRVRVRRELLPLMRELSPQVAEHLAFLADALAVLPPEPNRGFGRAQRLEIERAGRLGKKSAKIRVRGGVDLDVDLAGAKNLPDLA